MKINSLHATSFFLELPKTSENLQSFMFSTGYRTRSVIWNGLRRLTTFKMFSDKKNAAKYTSMYINIFTYKQQVYTFNKPWATKFKIFRSEPFQQRNIIWSVNCSNSCNFYKRKNKYEESTLRHQNIILSKTPESCFFFFFQEVLYINDGKATFNF